MPPAGVFGGIAQALNPDNVQRQLNIFNQSQAAQQRQANFATALQDFNLKLSTDPTFDKTVKEIRKFYPRAEQSPEAFADFTAAAEAHSMNQGTIQELTSLGILDPEQAKTFNKTSMLDPDRVAAQLNSLTGAMVAKQKEDNKLARINAAAVEGLRLGDPQAAANAILADPELSDVEKTSALRTLSGLRNLTAPPANARGSDQVNLDQLGLGIAAQNIRSEDQLVEFINTPAFKALSAQVPGITEEFTSRARSNFSETRTDVGQEEERLIKEQAFKGVMDEIASEFDSVIPGASTELTDANIDEFLRTDEGKDLLSRQGLSEPEFKFQREQDRANRQEAIRLATSTSLEGRRQIGDVIRAGGSVMEDNRFTVEPDNRFGNLIIDRSKKRESLENDPGVASQLIINTPNGPVPAIESSNGEFIGMEFSGPRSPARLFQFVQGPAGPEGQPMLVKGAEILESDAIRAAEETVLGLGKDPIPKVRELVRKFVMDIKRKDEGQFEDPNSPLGALGREGQAVLGTLDAFSPEGGQTAVGPTGAVAVPGQPRFEQPLDFAISAEAFLKLAKLRQRLKAIDRNLFVTPSE